MSRSSTVRIALAVLVAGVGPLAACSSDPESAGETATTMAEGGETVTYTGATPEEIAPPPAEGKGVNQPQPAAPIPANYVAEELIVGGTATSFEGGETPADGQWTASPGDEAEYRTRIIVRRPAAAEDFSGVVIVEWFNVSAIEASPDWAFTSKEITREGHAYVGVSAQAQGVEGGDTLLDVDADPSQVAASGVSTDTSGLKNIDPERYGTLVHPGDAYSYDIFAQVGRAVTDSPDTVLGGLQPTTVIGAGESQSAAFMSTFVNAVHPLDPVFDGFLVHSRGGGVAPLDGDMLGARGGENAESWRESGTRIRTDLDVPTLIFETESDLTLLGYAHARQPDSETVRTWEVAGLSHADAHFIRSIIGGPRDPGVGDLLGCTDPINIGPQHEVLQAGLHHLVAWADGGEPPPAGAQIELEDGDDVVIARDERGLALGGVRHPLVDVPHAAISGDPPGGGSIDDLTSGEGGICMLFGTTTMFDQQTLVDLHGSADEYVESFRASADEAVAAGFLLRPDADALAVEADANRALFG